jgi:hypothetical protein
VDCALKSGRKYFKLSEEEMDNFIEGETRAIDEMLSELLKEKL